MQRQTNIDLNKIQAIGCDGTNTNIGWKTGAMRRLEEKFKGFLHWNIYQLHGNKLPLRHLLIQLDGKTSGPTQFTGTVGKLFNETRFENLQVVNFQPIPAETIDINEEHFADLTSDQKYLLEMYRAVSSGFCEPTLASRKSEKMVQSRWLPTTSEH